jgi:LuxR family maltose regulon positive regulatory protein
MTFPRTKIQPPQPRPGQLLPRPALEQALGEALLTRRLVWVCAAAGYGKTSALARQVALLPPGTALAWVACDEDDSPTHLLECLVAALEPFDPPWRTEPQALLRAAAEATTPVQRRTLAAQLINTLDACDVPHGVVVVDDLHRVHHAAVFEFLDLLLERLGPRWTLALASRTELPLALARLRAQGEVAEFRAEALRFGRDEAQALGRVLNLPEAAVQRLYERSQGWPAGLRLALNALRGAPASAATEAAAAGSAAIDRQAIEFLTDEVIAQMAAPLRDFLLACSVLPELNERRCIALTGDAQAAARLAEIERAGLFVQVQDGIDSSLRLHDLFREALFARLAREQPQRLAALFERAAEGEDDELRRVGWLQRAGAWDSAAQQLAAAAEGLVSRGQGLALRDLLERFPAAVRQRHPGLQMAQAMLGWVRWDWETAIAATAAAAGLWAEAGEAEAARSARSYHAVALAGANRREARAAIDSLLAEPGLAGPPLCRALVASCWVDLRGGDQHAIAMQWTRMMNTLEGHDGLARWYECCPLPPFVGLPGMRAPLQRYIDGALRRLPEHTTPLRGMCQVVQGWLHLWRGDVERAQACADAAEADSRWLARPVNVDSYTRSLQAVLLALRGRREAALDIARGLVHELSATAQGGGEPLRLRVYLSLYQFLQMRCAALLDDAPALAEAARPLAASPEDGPGWLSPQQRAGAAAHLAALDGDLEEACARWRNMLVHEQASDLYGQLAEVRLRLADALWQRERPPAEAAAVLAPLFERVAEAGEWGAALMAGPRVLQRLAARPWGAALRAERHAELARWAAAAQQLRGEAASAAVAPGAADATTPLPATDESLTAREREVLQRIAAGDSNKLIARAFDLSPHTVKRHVANILDKLGLQSRGQAAAWLRQHG